MITKCRRFYAVRFYANEEKGLKRSAFYKWKVSRGFKYAIRMKLNSQY